MPFAVLLIIRVISMGARIVRDSLLFRAGLVLVGTLIVVIISIGIRYTGNCKEETLSNKVAVRLERFSIHMYIVLPA